MTGRATTRTGSRLTSHGPQRQGKGAVPRAPAQRLMGVRMRLGLGGGPYA
jgi:hypothetical protein